MAQAKKTAKKAEETEEKNQKNSPSRASGSDVMRGEDAKHSEAYAKSTQNEQRKSSTKQNAESTDGVISSDDEQISTTRSSDVAKAGKRSPKAIKEAEEKEAKEARKVEAVKKPEDKPKKTIKPPRSKLERSSKKYKKASELIDKTKEYNLKDAIDLAIKTSTTKFDSSVELHVNLNVDPRQADQNVRGTVLLPGGSGKKLRIAVLAENDEVEAALGAGADKAGGDDLLAEVEKGKTDFDILITSPGLMPKLAKYARILGPKGLMPNPKSGTVTTNIAKAVTEAKAGKVEYRVDSTGIAHLAIGKVSFGQAKLEQNLQAVLASMKAAKPSSIKSNYVRSIYLTTSMGPSIRVITSEI